MKLNFVGFFFPSVGSGLLILSPCVVNSFSVTEAIFKAKREIWKELRKIVFFIFKICSLSYFQTISNFNLFKATSLLMAVVNIPDLI